MASSAVWSLRSNVNTIFVETRFRITKSLLQTKIEMLLIKLFLNVRFKFWKRFFWRNSSLTGRATRLHQNLRIQKFRRATKYQTWSHIRFHPGEDAAPWLLPWIDRSRICPDNGFQSTERKEILLNCIRIRTANQVAFPKSYQQYKQEDNFDSLKILDRSRDLGR